MSIKKEVVSRKCASFRLLHRFFDVIYEKDLVGVMCGGTMHSYRLL